MQKKRSPKNRLPALLISSLILFANFLYAAEKTYKAGLIAEYKDGKQSVRETVILAELGLSDNESPHPAVAAVFSVNYSGLLKVESAGEYEFFTKADLYINDKAVKGKLKLKGGYHTVKIVYKHKGGPVKLGLSWSSNHFTREPIPPSSYWHKPSSAADIKVIKGKNPSPPLRIRLAFKNQKCSDCHETQFLATLHHKFNTENLSSLIRHAGAKKWYGKETGPVITDNQELKQLVADLKKLPYPQRKRPKVVVDHNKTIKMVGTKGGFACIACHDLKHHRSDAESKGPNLSLMTERVSYDWFYRWMENPGRLKPGVAMPAFFASQGHEERQINIDRLWEYMRQGDKMTVPAELKVDPKQFILTVKTKPIVQRVYLRLPDGRELVRAICVGLPNGMSYCFDAESCQLVYAWTGGYLDMTDHWKSKSLHPVKIIGQSFYLPGKNEGLKISDKQPSFKGYELIKGTPKFEFSLGETAVSLFIDSPAAGQLRQSYSIASRKENIEITGPDKKSSIKMSSSIGSWKDNRIIINDSADLKLNLTLKKKD